MAFHLSNRLDFNIPAEKREGLPSVSSLQDFVSLGTVPGAQAPGFAVSRFQRWISANCPG
jgi:hypothetical protein